MPWGARLVCFWVPGLLLFSGGIQEENRQDPGGLAERHTRFARQGGLRWAPGLAFVGLDPRKGLKWLKWVPCKAPEKRCSFLLALNGIVDYWKCSFGFQWSCSFTGHALYIYICFFPEALSQMEERRPS